MINFYSGNQDYNALVGDTACGIYLHGIAESRFAYEIVNHMNPAELSSLESSIYPCTVEGYNGALLLFLYKRDERYPVTWNRGYIIDVTDAEALKHAHAKMAEQEKHGLVLFL